MAEPEEDALSGAEDAATELANASGQAFETFRTSVQGLDLSTIKNYHRSLVEMVGHAEETSRAIGQLREASLMLPALALLRVRLEQTIICSYLLHEESDEIYHRYFSFGPITEYRTLSEVLKRPELAEHTLGRVDMDAMRTAALQVERSFNAGFDIQRGKFTSKWTALDLYSMALRRDTVCEESCRVRELTREPFR
jgi:Family of unknown function (DUF5677)